MSYILDALRRADSERDRGTVPTINAQPLPVDGSEDERPRSRLWLWAAAAIGFLLLGALASRLLMQGEGESREAPPSAAAGRSTAATAASSSAVTDVQVAAQAAPQITPQITPQVSVPPKVEPRPAPASASITAPAVAPAAVAATPVTPAAPASAVADRPVPTLKDLPDAIRRELPALVTGGSMYSDTPTARMIILNGQVFHEGDTVVPQLVLEQIKPRGAVLSFKGYRYSIGY